MEASHDELSELLAAGASALEVALTGAQQQALLDYLALLNRWNAAINLTAIRNARQQLATHLLDCLAIIAPLRGRLRAGAVVLDVGSGGGLPGVVLAICHPDVQIHCVDAVGKKAAFITQVKGALRLTNLVAHHRRVEQLQPAIDMPACDLIVSRAFATLSDFVALTRALLAPDGRWAAMKGVPPDEEIAALPAEFVVESKRSLQVPGLDARRTLVVLALRR